MSGSLDIAGGFVLALVAWHARTRWQDRHVRRWNAEYRRAARRAPSPGEAPR